MVNTSHFAILDGKQESNKLQFTGMLLKFEEGKIRIATTDSRRLVSNAIDCDTKDIRTDVVLPMKTMRETCNLIGKTKSDTVSFVMTEGGGLLFSFGNLTIMSRLIVGKFPKYEQLIPPSAAITLSINSKILLKSLKQINNVIGIKNIISLNLTENNLHINNWGNESSIGNIDLDIVYTGEPLELFIDPRFLIEMLSEFDSVNVLIGIKDKDSVIKINVEGKVGYDYIIVPMRI
jgi:DNA polymerase-3 subunit beta